MTACVFGPSEGVGGRSLPSLPTLRFVVPFKRKTFGVFSGLNGPWRVRGFVCKGFVRKRAEGQRNGSVREKLQTSLPASSLQRTSFKPP